jgi:uridine kinase
VVAPGFPPSGHAARILHGFGMEPVAMGLGTAVDRIRAVRQRTGTRRATMVAISGIDASGKGYLTQLIDRSLSGSGLNVATLHGDAWLRLPPQQLEDPVEHFYRDGFRFQEMFSNLVLPLRDKGCVRVIADTVHGAESAYCRSQFEFSCVDIVLLEGIFLMKPDFVAHYDLSIWVECSFGTALQRAVSRRQEGLGPEETIRAYRTLYFPAQLLHFERDAPRAAADLILDNDPAEV